MLIDITPVSKPRLTQRDKWAHRPAVDRYFAFCDELRFKYGGNRLPEELYVVAMLPMPKSWSDKKKRLMMGKPHQQKPDADNLLKAVQDALAKDDSYIWDARITKLWGYEGKLMITELLTFPYSNRSDIDAILSI